MSAFAIVQSVKGLSMFPPRRSTRLERAKGPIASTKFVDKFANTHPFDCPVSYPREVIPGENNARKQRQTPERVIFDHGYSTSMKGLTLEIDEIRHRGA